MCFVRSAFHPEIPKNSHSIESAVPSAVVDDDEFLNPNLGVVKLKSMYVCTVSLLGVDFGFSPTSPLVFKLGTHELHAIISNS